MARFWRKHRVRVPFSDVVVSGVLIVGAGKECLKPSKCVLYASNKESDCPSLVYRDIHDLESIASDQLETAQRYVTERVQEKPIVSTLTAVGIGVVIGMLLAGGRR